MIYIITEGGYSDYTIRGLIEGPPNLNTDDIKKEIEAIDQQLQITHKIRENEWRAKYPETENEFRSHWSEEAKRTYPQRPGTGDVIAEWLSTHPEFHIIEWDEVNLYL